VLLAHGADADLVNLNGSTALSRVRDEQANYDPMEDWSGLGHYLYHLEETEALIAALTQNQEGK
jgi:hypothetical protein